jgi:hypothetical protein
LAVSPLTFSTTYNNTTTHPVGKHPARAELQRLHDETKDYLNDTLKPAVDALQASADKSAKGSTPITTNASGVFTIPFGKTLTNAVVVAVNGDSNTTNILITPNYVAGATTTFTGKAYWSNSNTPVVSTPIRVNWQAQGD